MAKQIIVKCPKCGHDFIEKKPRSGIVGAVVGGAIASTIGLTVTIGTVGFGAPIVGAVAGYALTHINKNCKCPKCNAEVEKPET